MNYDNAPRGFNIEGSDESVLTHVNQLTNVNTRCVRKIERTRIVGFRIPTPVADAYMDLPPTAKTTLKTIVSSLIYAFAKKYEIEVECEEFLRAWINDVPAIGGQIIINANIAEAKSNINISVDPKAIEEIVDLLGHLYSLISNKIDYKAELIVKQRIAKAQRTLRELIFELN